MADTAFDRRVRKDKVRGLGVYRFLLYCLPALAGAGAAAPFLLRARVSMDEGILVLACVVSALLSCSVLAALIARGIFARVGSAAKASQRILQGDISAKADLQRVGGPLQPLTELASNLLEGSLDHEECKSRVSSLESGIQDLTETVRKAAAGDLTVNTVMEGSMAALADRLSSLLAGYRELAVSSLELAAAVERTLGMAGEAVEGDGTDVQGEAKKLASDLAGLYSKLGEHDDDRTGFLEETSQRLGIACLNLSRAVSGLDTDKGLEVVSLAQDIALECGRLRTSLRSLETGPKVSPDLEERLKVAASRAGMVARALEGEKASMRGLSSSAGHMRRAAARVRALAGLLRTDLTKTAKQGEEYTREADGQDKDRGAADSSVEDQGGV